MLYEYWLQISTPRQNQTALIDLSNDRRWTFGELAGAVGAAVRTARVNYPTGTAAEFILEVLRAWREGQIVCPLEPGQAPAEISVDLPEGIAHLKTTSATTGTPRLVAFTAAQLKADVDNIVATMGLRPDWPNLGLISLAHSYGFSNLVLPLLLHGIPLILAPSALPEAIRRAAQTAPAVSVAGVPLLWRTWYDADAIPPNVRLAISAGAPLDLALEQKVFARHGLKIHNFYGSSECGGIAYDASTRPRTDGGCAGAPLRNVTVTVAADRCVEVRSGAVGETYWPLADATLKDGVFHTCDLGELSGGIVFLRGRASDQINVAGRKVVPEVIERVLAAHPDVRACLAFGVPSADEPRGETIVACIAGRGLASGESLKQYAISRLPAWQVPREWWFVEALEANHRGKLSRAEWRKRYLERTRAGQLAVGTASSHDRGKELPPVAARRALAQ